MNKWLALGIMWIGYGFMRLSMACMKLAFKLNPPPKITVEQELHLAGLFLHSAHQHDKRKMH